MSDLLYTKWHMEMDIFYKVKPIMIMEGNILDQFQYPTDQSVVDITRYLKIFLKDVLSLLSVSLNQMLLK